MPSVPNERPERVAFLRADVAHCRCQLCWLSDSLTFSQCQQTGGMYEARSARSGSALREHHSSGASNGTRPHLRRHQRMRSRCVLVILRLPTDHVQQRPATVRAGRGIHVLSARGQVPVTPRLREVNRAKRRRAGLAWAVGVALSAFIALASINQLRAVERPASIIDQTLQQALGAPTGVLAVLNPVNCSLGASDAAALNELAAVPGVRVTVFLLAVPPHDSVLHRVRRDFAFAPQVSLQSASRFNAGRLPEFFRQPFVAVIKRGQLRHAAWGEAIKSLGSWLPELAGLHSPSGAESSP